MLDHTNEQDARVSDSGQQSGFARFMRVMRRRWRWALVPIVFLPLFALAYSLVQKKAYQASATVLLSRQDLANSLLGLPNTTPATSADFAQIEQTQSQIASSPKVAAIAARNAREGVDAATLLRAENVAPTPGTDFLLFNVTDPRPDRAIVLVNALANAYITYRRQLDAAAIQTARNDVGQRLAALAHHPRGTGRDTALQNDLVSREVQLETLQALQTSNASVVGVATKAPLSRPKTAKNIALGLLVGLLLGFALVYLRDALDNRISTSDELEEVLGLPVLGHIPPPPKQVVQRSSIVMLDAPNSVEAEQVRLARMGLEFAALGNHITVIACSSAVEREGKSTTVANVGVAMALAGRRVTVVDLDLRRPAQAALLGISGRHGVTDVLLGKLSLDDALHHVELAAHSPDDNGFARSATTDEGSLLVLPAGTLPPRPSDLLTATELGNVFSALRERADVVLVDTPPLLRVSDAVVLSRQLDGMFLVARMGVVTRRTMRELSRVVGPLPCRQLGCVVTGTQQEGSVYGSGHYYYSSSIELTEDLPRGPLPSLGRRRA